MVTRVVGLGLVVGSWVVSWFAWVWLFVLVVVGDSWLLVLVVGVSLLGLRVV